MANENSVGFQNEMKFLRNELKNLQKVRPVKGGFIATDSDLMKFLFPGDGDKVLGHLLRRIESSDLFWLNDDLPGPTE